MILRKPLSNFKPVILVTGCGSGIGFAIADLLYRSPRYRVVVSARANSLPLLHDRFQENERFLIRQLDITKSEERIAVVREIEQRWYGVNILVNNAGISYRAVVEHMTEAHEQRQFATNYFGPTGLIREVLPRMREIGRGKIINVSSVSGMLAMPTMASYSASKHALDGFSEALWYEMKPLGINVTLIQPGFVRSLSFTRVYYTEKSHPSRCSTGPYADYYANMVPFIAKLMKFSFTTPEKIASKIVKVIQTENPPLWVAVTIDAWIFYYLRRLLPRRLLQPLLFLFLPKSRKWGAGYSHRRYK